MEKITSKVCDVCGRTFMSENDNDNMCYICKEEDKDVQSFQERALEEEEISNYVEQQNKIREKWMLSMVRKHVSLWDRFLFFFYKRLADRFGGQNRVVPIQQRDALNDTQFGIRIYGKEYWYAEKETSEL